MGVLTYMSIREWIEALIEAGRLFELELPEGEDIERPMFVGPEVQQLIDGPWLNAAAEARGGELLANLQFIAAGSEIPICVIPFKAKDATMGLLNPIADGVWDIRRQKPSPGMRVVGRFAQQDMFLALISASRSKSVEYLSRGPLGDRDSPEWQKVISETRSLWQSLMPMWPPVTGDDPSAYFSDNYRCI